MGILMRNKVFKTAALAGLFSCVVALVGVFSDIQAQAQGFEDFPGSDIVPAITADQVGTSKERLKEFVEAAVDAYYVDFLIRELCDFWEPVSEGDKALVPFLLAGHDFDIEDLTPESIETLTTEEIKRLIPILTEELQTRDPTADPWVGCDLARTSEFHDALRSEDGPWREDPVYLFILDDDAVLHFHGINENVEGQELVASDAGGRNVGQLIVNEAQDPQQGGFVEYCWNDPTVEGDDIVDYDPMTAPGDSWKISYVVDPIEHLGLSPIPGFPRFIGSGIYPKNEDGDNGMLPSGCRIVTDGDEEETDDEEVGDSGGCMIAGSGGTAQTTAINLLLLALFLFVAVSFGSRAAGKQNGVRS